MTEQDPYFRDNPYSAPQAKVESEQDDIVHPRFLSFSGRIGRIRYLAYSFGFMIVAYFILGIVTAITVPMGEAGGVIALILGIIGVIAMLVAGIAFGVRRLNDLNKSGWWVLLYFIPIVSLFLAIYMIFFPGTEGRNDYGPMPAPNTTGVYVAFIVPVALLILLLLIAVPSYMQFVERAEQMQMEQAE